MRTILKILAFLTALVAFTLAVMWWKPVLASRLIWPLIENNLLADEFLGITAQGEIRGNLYTIKSTGASTASVVEAAKRLIGVLSTQQQEEILFAVDDLEWRRWANIHISTRQGVGLLEMDEAQTGAAMNLLATSLSIRGFETARNIMKLEGHLADLMDDHNQYGEKRYWFTIMGEPSASEPWGWQIDGHHLIINYFVLGDQVVMTPLFMGSEPPEAKTGRYAGTSILSEELNAGLALINSLDNQQRSIAIIESSKTANNNRGELFQDNAVVPYAGIGFGELNPLQAELANAAIQLYIGKLDDRHAGVKMDEIRQHWNETRFAWVGGTDPESVFYYRIHSPVVMIEYDHQMPVALSGPSVPTRAHVHTVVRTPNGNDYGKDLLRLHLQQHPIPTPTRLSSKR
ncbi:MAG: DUF3500 domain-containing protein [bacterium]|nr:DUF3500 domain-containing protein [Gammaproteobacteria bacterium]